MKRQHRRWHPVIWCLLLPAQGALLVLAVGPQPAALLNPDLPPTLANTPVDNPAANTGKPR